MKIAPKCVCVCVCVGVGGCVCVIVHVNTLVFYCVRKWANPVYQLCR